MVHETKFCTKLPYDVTISESNQSKVGDTRACCTNPVTMKIDVGFAFPLQRYATLCLPDSLEGPILNFDFMATADEASASHESNLKRNDTPGFGIEQSLFKMRAWSPLINWIPARARDTTSLEDNTCNADDKQTISSGPITQQCLAAKLLLSNQHQNRDFKSGAVAACPTPWH